MLRRSFLFSLLIVLLLGALAWKQFAQGIPLETNLLRLLPATEANPVAEQALEHLTRAVGDRALFLVGHADRAQAIHAAKTLADGLKKNAVFKTVRAEIPALNLEQLRAPFLAARFHLLSAEDRSDLARDPAGALQHRLQQRLAMMMGGGMGLKLEADPFDYFGRYLSSLPWQESRLMLQDGVLLLDDGTQTWVLVMAELQGSAFTEAVQDQAIHAVTQAQQAMLQAQPGAQLLRTGGVFYAQAARSGAQHDVDLIGTISTIGILLLLLAAFRSPAPLFWVALSVVVGLGVALLVTVSWFGSLHLLTLVFGASLIGEAVDYAIQVCSVHAGHRGNDWNARRDLQPLWPSLSIALATSVLGYLVLFLTPFPALNQIALFASSGLIAAFLVVRFWMPAGLRGATTGRARGAIAWCQRSLQALQRWSTPRRALFSSALVLLVAAPGLWLIHADDDVRLLSTRPVELVQQEQQFRALVSQDADARFFLVEAATEQELLQREEQLRSTLEPLVQKNQMSGVQAVSAFVPSLQRQQENRQLLEQAGMNDAKKLSTLLEQEGFHARVATHLQQDFVNGTTAPSATLAVSDWLAAPLSTPYRHLWLGKTSHGYGSIVMPKNLKSAEGLEQLRLPGVTWVDKTTNVSRLFAFYRQAGVWGLLLMVGVLFAVLSWRYGWRGSLRVLLPTVVALISAPALLGYLHLPLTLFSILALFLVLGVGVNYSIFLLDGARLAKQQGGESAYGGANLLGIVLSSITTLLSFGLLAFSSMPVLRQFGLVLAAGILLAVLLSPLSLAWEREVGTKGSGG